eukprot:Pgem_evm1s10425
MNKYSTQILNLFEKDAEPTVDDVFTPSKRTKPEIEPVEIMIKWAFVTVTDVLFDHIPNELDQTLVIEAVDLFVTEISHRTWEPTYMWLCQPKRIYNFCKGSKYLRAYAQKLLSRTHEQVEASYAKYKKIPENNNTDGIGSSL